MTRTAIASLLATSCALTLFTTAADARVTTRVSGTAAASVALDTPATSATLINVQRTSGDKLITPDALTVAAILRSERQNVIGVFNVCIDSKGDVADINVVRSTSFPAYDAKIQRQVRTWKYQPVLLGGLPAPVCTKVTFVYQQKQ